MKRVAIALLVLAAFGCAALARSPFLMRGTGGPLVPNASQAIASVTQFTSSTTIPANTANAVVGTVTVTMSPPTPPFGGSLSITGANSCGFQLSGGTQVQAGASGCSATGGPHGNGLYDDWSIVATQSGISNSPFTQAEAASAVSANLAANPTTINSGQSSTLTWSSTNASSCTGTNFSTGNATSGSTSVSPSSTTTYSVNCNGATASATVTVNSSGGTACVEGPNDFRALPAPVVSDGFTTCLANFDWSTTTNFSYNSNTYNLSQVSTWLDCAGAGNNALWWNDLNGIHNTCSDISIVNDASAGTNVLSIAWFTADPLDSTGLSTIDPTERIGTTYPTNRYSEVRVRMADAANSVYSDIFFYNDGGMLGGGHGSNQTDLFESNGTANELFGGMNTSDPCNNVQGTCFIAGINPPAGWDATQWHTYGVEEFFNTDNTKGGNIYIDGAFNATNGSGAAVTVDPISGVDLTHTRVYAIMTTCFSNPGCHTNGIQQHTTLVQYYRMYSCSSGYSGNNALNGDVNHACNRPVRIGPP